MNEKMDLTFYFLRHGQTALSREDVFCGSGLDPEPTPEGSGDGAMFLKRPVGSAGLQYRAEGASRRASYSRG